MLNPVVLYRDPEKLVWGKKSYAIVPLYKYIYAAGPTSSKAYIKADIPCALRTAHAIT
jgi:hypothetical protein